MEQTPLLRTARGVYRLTVMEQSRPADGSWVLVVAVEHTGGLEKFGLRCRIAGGLPQKDEIAEASAAGARLAVWVEGQFEQIREAALKSVRSERRLAEFVFDREHPGPF